MNQTDIRRTGHPEDRDLIRLHDGECTTEEERSLRDHLAGCGDCDDRFRAFARRAPDFETALNPSDRPEPPHASRARHQAAPSWWTARGFKMAASIAALAGATAAVPPARTWIVGRWQALTGLVTRHDSEQPQIPALSDRPASTVSFQPGATHFVVEFANAQPGGKLVFTIDTVSNASARVVNGDGSEEWIVLPSGVRLQNSAGSAATYEITLPTYVATAELRLGGVLVGTYELDIVARPRFEVELAAAR